MMEVKRYKYSLRSCNPRQRMQRKEINELDFIKKFPFYSFDESTINLELLRRFLYKNEIPYYYVYTDQMIKDQKKDRKKLSKQELEEIYSKEKRIDSRFEILDL